MSRMNQNRGRWGWQFFRSLLGVGGAITLTEGFVDVFLGNCVSAQILPDNTLGAERSVVTPNININGLPAEWIDGGATRGVNLFHSFSEFNVGNGQRVYFANPTGIENILTRVTGSNLSNILGTLGVDGGANLFLLNPNGIFFGQNASLDIAGSFFASTADSVVFNNGYQFSAKNPESPPLLTISVRPGLQYGSNQSGATIANSGNLTVGKDLTLAAGNLDLQGQLIAGENLTLEAQDTVKVRDSVANPFIASSGRQLLVQGNQGVDIFALNHPDSGFFSGGDLVLRSANNVGGDAHYSTSGNFRIEQLDGSIGNLDSPYDPVILSGGNVSLGDYTGASLHILAGGSVTLGNVTLTNTDSIGNTINPNNDTLFNGTWTLGSLASFNLSDGTPFTINGNINRTLDVRAGVDWSQLGGLPTPNPSIFGTIIPAPTLPATPLTADITVTGNINVGRGTVVDIYSNLVVLLTNQYHPNPLASGGTISTQSISTQLTIGGYLFSLSGAIVVDSRNGITISDLYARDSGKDGIISLITDKGDIRLGDIDSSAISTRYGIAGAGGAISITARDGNIKAGNINSSTSSLGQTGNGGAISLKATGDISVADVDSHSFNMTRGNGGDISLITINGNITTGNLSSFVGNPPDPNQPASPGTGGAISLSATNGIITTKNIYAYSSASTAGTVRLNADSINVGDILAMSPSFSLEGNGSSISLIANNDITTRSLNTTGKRGSGNIIITSNQGAFSSVGSVIASDTFGSGKGGDIQITARSVSLTNGAQVSASTHSTGQGGTITLRTSERVELTNVTPDGQPPALLFAGNSLAGIPEGQYLGGFIPTTGTTPQIPIANGQYPSGLFTQTTTNSTGNAGNIVVETGQILISNQAAIAATAFGQGDAGNISVKANEAIAVDNGSILSGVPSGSNGNSGTINLETGSLSLTRGGIVQTYTLGEGNAGDIEVKASNAVNLSGVSTTTGRSSGLISGSQGTNSGTGGNITVQTGAMRVTDGAVLSAKTFSTQRSGDITVNADSLEVLSGGQFLTTTFGSGRAGDIRVRASDRITLAGSDPTYVGRVAQFGDTVVDPDGSASGILARSQGTGRAGQLNFTTQNLTISDGAQATVSSIGTVTAGNLEVQARHVVLNNQGRVTAETEAGEGGNTVLQDLDTLQVNNSVISASTKSGTAGDVSVNATQSIQLSGRLIDGTSGGLLAEATAGGNARSLRINTGQLTISDGAQTTVSSTGTGSAGNLDVTATSVELNNQAKLSAETVLGVGGNINLHGLSSLSLNNNSEVSASTVDGQGGNVEVNASDSVNVNRSSGLFARATENGSAGSVKINTNQLNLQDDSQAAVSSTGTGSAGNLDVTATSVELNNQAKLSAETVSGVGGNINLQGLSSLTLNNNSEVSASTVDGQGGNVEVNALDAVNLNSDSGLYARATGNGSAGSVRIITNQLTIQDGSQASVSNTGSGSTGNLEVTAGSIFMNNQGNLTAKTVSGEGGNIRIQVDDTLLLRDNSNILTEALGSGNGGNITINAGGFILAIRSENSDIAATAIQGQGGNVFVTAQGVFGFNQSDGLVRTPESDISAASELGINGTREVKAPEYQPVVTLPQPVIRPQVTQNCQPNSSSRQAATAQFYNTGRGGLPPNPVEALNSNTVQVPWVTLDSDTENPANSAISTDSKPEQLVEAQGWEILPNGQVRLTAKAPNFSLSPCVYESSPNSAFTP